MLYDCKITTNSLNVKMINIKKMITEVVSDYFLLNRLEQNIPTENKTFDYLLDHLKRKSKISKINTIIQSGIYEIGKEIEDWTLDDWYAFSDIVDEFDYKENNQKHGVDQYLY